MGATLRPTIPDHLMDRVKRATATALPGFGSPTPGAYLLVSRAAADLMEGLGMLPDTDKSAEELAVALQWRATAAIGWLRKLTCGQELSAAEWDELAKYPNLLRECAAWCDTLLAQYHEGDQTR